MSFAKIYRIDWSVSLVRKGGETFKFLISDTSIHVCDYHLLIHKNPSPELILPRIINNIENVKHEFHHLLAYDHKPIPIGKLQTFEDSRIPKRRLHQEINVHTQLSDSHLLASRQLCSHEVSTMWCTNNNCILGT